MRLLALPMEPKPAEGLDATTADGRRARFLAAARPALDRAYRLAGVVLGDSHEAEDAVQDALATAWQSFDRLREPARFGAWFDRILVNNCRDRLRRKGMVRFVPIDAGLDRSGRDPFQAFIDRDEILRGLTDLSPDERLVVVLRFWADLPLDAIAERLDWPLGTVKSRLHRALGRLRAAVGRDGQEVSG
jgi:RNA polymerase sigma factor (sigma-70 family)